MAAGGGYPQRREQKEEGHRRLWDCEIEERLERISLQTRWHYVGKIIQDSCRQAEEDRGSYVLDMEQEGF